jgi:hypothetical protein
MRLGVFARCFSLLVEDDYYGVVAESGAVADEEKQQYEEVVELRKSTVAPIRIGLSPSKRLEGGTSSLHRQPFLLAIDIGIVLFRDVSVTALGVTVLHGALACEEEPTAS